MRSDKPEAKAFQNWVTRDVLPSIRRTGGYLLNEAARETAHADTREAACPHVVSICMRKAKIAQYLVYR